MIEMIDKELIETALRRMQRSYHGQAMKTLPWPVLVEAGEAVARGDQDTLALWEQLELDITRSSWYRWAGAFRAALETAQEEARVRSIEPGLCAVTIDEAARRLSLTPRQARHLVKAGQLRCIVLAGQDRIPMAAIRDLLAGDQSAKSEGEMKEGSKAG